MPQVVVIAGMGRSGTSLVASLLQQAGVDVGDRLLDPAGANPRGFFEDTDFVAFHERALKDRGHTNLAGETFVFEPSEVEKARAHELVAGRMDRALWGFKDPRASLFLDFWDGLLGEAVYLFMFRHPFDVLLSYLRYGESRATGLMEPVRAWKTYNARILEFRARHPERCALVHPHGLGAAHGLNDVLHSKLRLDISVTPEIVAQLYRPGELHAGDVWAHRAFAILEPETAEIYEELVRVADIVPPDLPVFDEPRELRRFRDLGSELLPQLGSHRRGLHLTLVELVAPDIAEGAIRAQRQWISGLEEAKEWLDEQRLAWMQIALERPSSKLLRYLRHRLRPPE